LLCEVMLGRALMRRLDQQSAKGLNGPGNLSR